MVLDSNSFELLKETDSFDCVRQFFIPFYSDSSRVIRKGFNFKVPIQVFSNCSEFETIWSFWKSRKIGALFQGVDTSAIIRIHTLKSLIHAILLIHQSHLQQTCAREGGRGDPGLITVIQSATFVSFDQYNLVAVFQNNEILSSIQFGYLSDHYRRRRHHPKCKKR